MKPIRSLVILLPLVAGPAAAQPAPAADDLDQRLRVVERKLELEEEKQAEAKKAAPLVTAGPEGFALKSADGAFQLKLRGYLQVDARFFLDDEERPATDTAVIRRARPIVEGTLYRIFDFKIMPDFGGGQTILYDGYLEARFSKAARLRAGKFKPPVGLERLQSATDLALVERSAPTLLVPSRDLGLQLAGDLAGGRLEYAVGVFNGVVDGGLADTATSDGKELAARIFWKPLQPADGSAPRVDLGLGLAATRGEQEGTPTAPVLPAYRTPGGQSFFAYRSDGTAAGTAIADGDHTRLVPQGWLYVGRFGALLEYATSEQRVRRELVAADLEQTAWQLQLSWVLTGERNSYRGVTPRQAFQPGGPGRGAWLIAARVARLEVDDGAFPVFADPAKSASSADVVSLGVSWNLARGARWMLDYDLTRFEGGAATGDRPDERSLKTRFQVTF